MYTVLFLVFKVELACIPHIPGWLHDIVAKQSEDPTLSEYLISTPCS